MNMNKRWEYKTILSYGISDEEIKKWEEELNNQGSDGWELISMIVRPEVPSYEHTEQVSATVNPRAVRTVAFLKREKMT